MEVNINTEHTTSEDHRWSERCPVEIPVKIYRGGQFLSDCNVNNISLEGMHIGDKCSTLNPNTYIEVEFDLANNNDSMHYRLPALVRHISPHGAGVMFMHFSSGTFRHFHRILYDKNEQTANSTQKKPRWSPRKNINLNLSLYQSGKKIAEASTSNLSFEGVFIKTTLTPPLYSFLTVEFFLSNEEGDQIFQAPCLVRHRTNFGIGLMFIDFQLEMFNCLRHTLHPKNNNTDNSGNLIPATKSLPEQPASEKMTKSDADTNQ